MAPSILIWGMKQAAPFFEHAPNTSWSDHLETGAIKDRTLATNQSTSAQ